MRPIANNQNLLMFPLNGILRTEGGVRVLRSLAGETRGALSVPDITSRTGLTAAGVWRAIERLVQCGIVADTSAGQRRQYALCRETPIARVLVTLFEAEHQRYGKLLKSLRHCVRKVSPQPECVWIKELPQEPGDPLVLGFLHSSRHVSKSARQFRRLLTEVEHDFDITIEINIYTRADLPRHGAEEKLVIFGKVPPRGKSRSGRVPRTQPHQELDRRSLARCRALVSLIEKDKSLIRRAQEHVERLLDEGQGAADHDLREWLMILESYSLHRLLEFIVSSVPRATRLRQSCPFFAVLNAQQRVKLKEKVG